MGSTDGTWSRVFSVTHRSLKPRASARWATCRMVATSMGSGDRWGSDMPSGMSTTLRSLDDFDLRPVGRLQESDAPAVRRRQLFQHAHAVGAEAGHRPGVV